MPNNKEIEEKIKSVHKKKTPETTTEKLIGLMRVFSDAFRNVIVFSSKS